MALIKAVAPAQDLKYAYRYIEVVPSMGFPQKLDVVYKTYYIFINSEYLCIYIYMNIITYIYVYVKKIIYYIYIVVFLFIYDKSKLHYILV